MANLPLDTSMGELAVKMRLLSKEDFEAACRIAKEERLPLERVLRERGYLRDSEIQMLQVALGTTGVIRRLQ